jgi:hypothetical protein
MSNSLPILNSATPISGFSPTLVFNASISQIKDGTAFLLTEDLNSIEYPLIFLPKNLRKGNLVTFRIERNFEEEEKRKEKIEEVQKRILGKGS